MTLRIGLNDIDSSSAKAADRGVCPDIGECGTTGKSRDKLGRKQSYFRACVKPISLLQLDPFLLIVSSSYLSEA